LQAYLNEGKKSLPVAARKSSHILVVVTGEMRQKKTAAKSAEKESK
jgi:hypothetical protein